MTAPRAREQAGPPSPPDRRPPRRGGGSSPSPYGYASAAGRPAGPARPCGARRGLVRSARALAAAALLALSGALALPATAQADVLVSNFGQSTTFTAGLNDDFYHGQAFSVGADGGNYTLSSIEIPLLYAGIAAADIGSLSVSVWSTGSSGFPSALLHALVNPASITAGTTVTFNAQAGATLEAGKTYAVVVYYDKDYSVSPAWSQAESGEDANPAMGWEIADSRMSRAASGTTWSNSSSARVYVIRVNGTAAGGGTPTLPTLSIADASGAEDAGVQFTATLTAGVSTKVTATWTASIETGDTAVAADLATTKTGDVEFEADAMTTTFTVPVTDDTTAEDDETFTVTLSNVSSNAQLAADPTAKGTIEDDDGTTLPTLSVGNSLGTEGSIIDFPLTLSAAASADVTVTCTASIESGDTAAAADLSSNTSGTATITASGTSGRCSIRTVQDTIDEEDETFTVTLSNVSSNAQLATDPTAKGTIVDDDTAPTITDVSVTSTPVLATGTYGAGETIEVSVTFDEAVNATSATDFELNVSDDKSAPLLRGSGTQTLVFGYTVAPGDADDNGIWIGDQDRTLVGDRRLTTQAGAITSTATGTAADLTHTELGRQDNHKVDGTRSIVSVAVTSTPQLETDTYGAGETIEFTVTFNVAVDVTGDPVLEFLLDGSEVRQASDVSGSGTTTLVFSYTVVSGDDDDNGLFIRDESDYNNPDGPVRLDSNDEIEFKDTSTDVPLYWAGRGTQSGHKVDGSRTTDNVAPSFTSSATFDAAENQTDVGTVLAADSDADDSVTGYAIAGGADMALFEIGATSGELAFKTAPDFEDPDTDNVHEVTVRATSGTGTRVMTADQTITVTVTDVNEQSATPDKPTLAAVSGSSTSLTATWTKPGLNGGPDITGYDVQYRAGATGTWSSSTSYGATVTTATITGLTADTSYQVQVLAKNGETDSDWSDASDAVSTNAETATPTCTLNTGDLWCGVVTVALYSADGFDLAYGFVDASESVNPSDTGALSDETFSVGTNNYTIDQASVARAESSTPFNLVFSLTSALDRRRPGKAGAACRQQHVRVQRFGKSRHWP